MISQLHAPWLDRPRDEKTAPGKMPGAVTVGTESESV